MGTSQWIEIRHNGPWRGPVEPELVELVRANQERKRLGGACSKRTLVRGVVVVVGW